MSDEQVRIWEPICWAWAFEGVARNVTVKRSIEPNDASDFMISPSRESISTIQRARARHGVPLRTRFLRYALMIENPESHEQIDTPE